MPVTFLLALRAPLGQLPAWLVCCGEVPFCIASPTLPHFVRHLPAARGLSFLSPCGAKAEDAACCGSVLRFASHSRRSAPRRMAVGGGSGWDQRQNTTCRKRQLQSADRAVVLFWRIMEDRWAISDRPGPGACNRPSIPHDDIFFLSPEFYSVISSGFNESLPPQRSLRIANTVF